MADTSFVAKVTSIAASWLQIINDLVHKGRSPNFATTTGSANVQVLTLASGSLYSTEADGDSFTFKAGFTNTAAMTLQVLVPTGTNAARAVQLNGQALVGGEVQAGQNYTVTRLGTTWQLLPVQLTDGLPFLVNAADITKKLRVSLAGFSTGQTRVITLPDAGITIAGPTATRTYTLPDANLTIPAVTTKGDLWVASSSGVLSKVGVGLDGAVLAADSTQGSGVGWGTVTGFTTGDVKLTVKTVADTGWVLMNDTTIGNAASAATGRANADTVALYTLLYNNTVDADCAVSGGRGANAAADYAANKTIALPKALGRALATFGTGSGLTARTMAKAFGEENHTLSIAELAAHTHTGTSNTGTSQTNQTVSSNGNNPAAGGWTSDSTGSGTAHNTMQPTLFLNTMIKL